VTAHDLWGAVTFLWEAVTRHWVAVFVLLVCLTVVIGARAR
jgi:hypothetical protein